MNAVDLVSNLPRGECVQRLHRDVGSYWGIGSGHAVIGEVRGDALRLRKRIYYRNSFQPTLRARLSDTPDGGTRIHGEFADMPLAPILVAAAAIVVLAAGVTVSMLARSGVPLQNFPRAAIIAPLAAIPFFVALPFGIVHLGRRLARDEPRYLTDFLIRTLEAHAAAAP